MKTDNNNKADKEENVHITGIIFTLELCCFLITVTFYFFSRNRSVGGSFQHCCSDETVLE